VGQLNRTSRNLNAVIEKINTFIPPDSSQQASFLRDLSDKKREVEQVGAKLKEDQKTQ